MSPYVLLRLVKASDEDPGTWMTEEEKYERFTYKGLGFVDITDTMVGLLALYLS